MWFKKQIYIGDDVQKIKNLDIRHFVNDSQGYFPDYFWTIDSSKKHHSKDERGKYGRLIHIKKCVRFSESIRRTGLFSDEDCDLLVAASILHDCCVRGKYLMEGDKSLPNHPMLVRELLSSVINEYEKYDWVEKLFGIIETHMGTWGCYDREGKVPSPIPRTLAELTFHYIDYFASRAYVKVEL
jgi:hypothetical protein